MEHCVNVNDFAGASASFPSALGAVFLGDLAGATADPAGFGAFVLAGAV